jgi:hypothetical protein
VQRGLGAVLVLLVTTSGVAGCGDGSGSSSGDVVQAFVAEYRDGDYNAACERVSSSLTAFDLADLAGADPTTSADCPELLRQIAQRGNSGLGSDAVLDVKSIDESDVADSSTIETAAGTWTLESSSDSPGGWEITGLPRG